MNLARFNPKALVPKRKLFVSYHSNDRFYRDRFDFLFGHLFVNKSVKYNDIDSDLSDSYVKRLIREGYLTDSSVCVVLVGPETYCRKHVDWEISAALSKKVGGHSGLFGLCLPNHPDYYTDLYYDRPYYHAETVSPRLLDNLESGYSSLYKWTEEERVIKDVVEFAFESRIAAADRIMNWRPQFRYNRMPKS